MSWFSKLGSSALRFEVELVIQTVRYKNLAQPLYLEWVRGDHTEKTRTMPGEKGVYDFQDMNGSPPEPVAPLKIPCTMYVKKDKFLPKKSKIYLKYKQKSGSEELSLGVAELNVSDHIDAKHPEVPVKETITLSFQKCLDKSSTVTFQFRARWLKDVDVDKLREEDPDAVSRASGLSAFVSQDGHSQFHDEDVDEPHDQEEDADELDEADVEARKRKKLADEKMIEKSKSRKVLGSPNSNGMGDEEDDGTGIGEFEEEEEDPEERAARKAAKKARKEAKAAKKAAKANKKQQPVEDEEEEETEDANGGGSAAYADILAAAPVPANGPSSIPSSAPNPSPLPRAGSVRGAQGATSFLPAAAVPEPVPEPAAAAVVEEEEDTFEPDDPTWTNFTGTIPYILALQAEEEPELDIPLPLHKLLKAVKKLGGYETEAIFKRGPADGNAAVDALRQRIEQGVYKLKGVDDPRVPAQCVKLWLSSIQIAVFPPHVHSLMLKAGSMDDIDVDAERKRREAEEEEERREQEEEDAAADAAEPNADPRYRKSKQAERANELYSDILSGLPPPSPATGAPASPKQSVRQIVEQVISLIPASHRAVLTALVNLMHALLAPKQRKKNGLDESTICTTFGDLLTRLKQRQDQKQYEFFLDRQYVNKFLEYVLKYSDVLETEFADVPYPRWKNPAPIVAATPTVKSITPAAAPTHAAPPDYSDLLVVARPSGAAPGVAPVAANLIQEERADTDDDEPAPQHHPPVNDEDESRPAEVEPVVEPAAAEEQAADAVVEEEEEQEDEVDEEEAERLRKERKKAKKEAKRLKKEAKRKKRGQNATTDSEEVEDAEEEEDGETAAVTPASVVAAKDTGLVPLPGLTPQKASGSPQLHAASPPDPFADIALPPTPKDPAPVPTAAGTSPPMQPLESFAPIEDEEESEEDRAARLAREEKAARKARKIQQQRQAEEQEAAAHTASAVVAASPYHDILGPAVAHAAPILHVDTLSSPAVVADHPTNQAKPTGTSPALTAAVSSIPDAVTQSRMRDLEARVKDLEQQVKDRDELLVAREAQINKLREQHVEAQRTSSQAIAELEQQLGIWRVEAKAATKARKEAEAQLANGGSNISGVSTGGVVVTPGSKGDPDARILKLKSKLNAAHDENDQLLEQLEASKKQVELLLAISNEKSHAMAVLQQQLAVASSTTSTVSSSSASRRAGASPSSATTRPVSELSISELSELVEAIKARVASDEAASGSDGLGQINESEAGGDDALTSASLASLGVSSKRATRERKHSSSISNAAAAGELASKDLEIRRLQGELQLAQENLAASKEHAEEHVSRVEELESEVEEQKKLRESDMQRLAEIRQDLEAKLQESSRRLVVAEESRSLAKKESEKAHAKVTVLETKLAAELPALESQLASSQEALSKLQNAHGSLERENESLQEQLAASKQKLKELITANEKRMAAAVTAAAPSPARRRAGESDSSDDDSSAASRRQRKISALSNPASSTSPSAQQDVLMYRQLLADKNHLIEDHEATEQQLKAKLEQLEQERSDLAAMAETSASTYATEIQKANEKNAELSASVKSLQRELDDLQRQTTVLLATPRKAPAAASPGKGASGDSSEEVAQLHAHITSLDMSIQSYVSQINTLEERNTALELKVTQLEAKTPGSSKASAKQLDALQKENADLHEQLEALQSKASSATSNSPSASSAALQEEVESLREQLNSTLEVHKLKLRDVEADAQSKIAILQKFKQALGEKFTQLEHEAEQLRERQLKFASLNDSIDKKYLDPSAKKKLERAELTLLQAFQEQQRRTAFLETQLKASDDTLRLTKETYNQTNLVLEQELEGLETENENLRELYQEVKSQLQRAVLQSSPRAHSAGEEVAIASITIDWKRYETTKTELARAEQSIADLTTELAQLRATLQTKSEQLESVQKKLAATQAEAEAVREELVRTGITLKTIASDNFEMKEHLREQAAKKK